MPCNTDTAQLILFICHAGYDPCFLPIICPFLLAQLDLYLSNCYFYLNFYVVRTSACNVSMFHAFDGPCVICHSATYTCPIHQTSCSALLSIVYHVQLVYPLLPVCIHAQCSIQLNKFKIYITSLRVPGLF